MGFTKAVAGNTIQITDLNQIIDAWEGSSSGGSHPLLLIYVNDAVNYAIDAKQLNSAGLIMRLRNASDEAVLTANKDNVILGKDTIVSAGVTIDTLSLASHVHTGVAGMGEQLTHASLVDRARSFFVPVNSAYNLGTSAAIVRSSYQGWPLPDGVTSAAFADFILPTGFVADGNLSIQAVFSANATGNVVVETYVGYGAVTEIYRNSTATTGAGGTVWAVDALGTQVATTAPLMADAAAGDIVHIYFRRYGAHASDTLTDDLFISGFVVTMTMDM